MKKDTLFYKNQISHTPIICKEKVSDPSTPHKNTCTSRNIFTCIQTYIHTSKVIIQFVTNSYKETMNMRKQNIIVSLHTGLKAKFNFYLTYTTREQKVK